MDEAETRDGENNQSPSVILKLQKAGTKYLVTYVSPVIIEELLDIVI
jgi:hypothetical protein